MPSRKTRSPSYRSPNAHVWRDRDQPDREAINYQHRGGATDVDLAGTSLLPSADGKAKVRSKRGTMEVEADFGNLQNPTTFGTEYLTYVLWAISPDGHAVNLGEFWSATTIAAN